MGAVSTAQPVRALAGPLPSASRRFVLRTLVFFGCWCFLSALLNVRYPASESAFWYLLPSLDVTALFFFYAALGAARRQVPPWAQIAVAAALLLFRLLRLGDGIEHVYLRTFNIYLDLQLLSPLVRILYLTVPLLRLALFAVAGLACAVGLAVATWRAIRYSERYLAEPLHRSTFLGIVAVCALVSLRPREVDHPEHYAGIFGASIVPRLAEEASFFLHARGLRKEKISEILAVEKNLRQVPAGLEKLRGAPVLFILIESYGATVFSEPTYAEQMRPTFDRFEAELADHGFSVASSVLESSTYGGKSWLAHATLATGVRVSDSLSYDLLREREHATMAGFFRQAGYETVLVQPGTTSRTPEPNSWGFERTYFAWDLDYHGPSYLWVPMPDQYVLDFVHRRELAGGPRPVFLELALVSSHAPWSAQANVVEDWKELAGGDIYNRLETTHFPITWTNLAMGGDAYLHSLRYDFTVLQQYIAKFLPEGALVILMGDHQPVSDVARQSSRDVPVHVLSKERALTQPFLAEGYESGMRPRTDRPSRGMETFLPTLLRAFSEDRASREAP